MTADDVKFSLERILDPKTGFPPAQEPVDHRPYRRSGKIPGAHSSQKPIQSVSHLSGGAFTPRLFPSESVGADGKVTHPLGTGPFSFVEWAKNDRLVVKKFESYWIKGLPYLDGIVFKPLPDDAVRLTALRTGQVHIIHSLPEKLLPSLSREKNNNFVLSINPGVSWRMLIMNTRKPPLDNVVLRQAIEAAVDREEIMLATTWGFGRGRKPDLGKRFLLANAGGTYVKTPTPKGQKHC